MEKYGPEKTLYLDTFHAVMMEIYDGTFFLFFSNCIYHWDCKKWDSTFLLGLCQVLIRPDFVAADSYLPKHFPKSQVTASLTTTINTIFFEKSTNEHIFLKVHTLNQLQPVIGLPYLGVDTLRSFILKKARNQIEIARMPRLRAILRFSLVFQAIQHTWAQNFSSQIFWTCYPY